MDAPTGPPPDSSPGDSSPADSGPTGPRTGAPWILTAIGALAALVLIIGFAVWVGGRDDEVTTGPSTTVVAGSTTSTTSTSSSTSTTTSTTSSTSTTTPTTTSTTVPETSVPSPTTVPGFALPAPGAASWTVELFHLGQPTTLTMELASTVDGLTAYDGETDLMRCVGIVGPDDGYSGWCGPTNRDDRFVIVRGITPWLVELGPDIGDVTLHERDPQWRLPSNGCGDAVASIVAAIDPGPFAVTGVACADDGAFVSVGTLLFGDQRAPDGGGYLLTGGDEGWVSSGGGTSFDCVVDGIDWCERFHVESELFNAVLPIPPVDLLEASADIVAVTDEYDAVRLWVGDADDPAVIDSIVIAELFDPDAEVPALARRTDGLGGGQLNLLIVEVPQLDDSVRSVTWAVWIGALEENPGVLAATSWATCARGVAGPDLCI